jgi:hypothetical protein
MEGDLPLAEQFLQELAENQHQMGGEGALDRFLDERAGRLTPELAEELAELSLRALMGQAWDMAGFAGNLAMSVNLRLGRVDRAFEARQRALQADYQEATTPEQYEAVRTQFLDLADAAKQAGDDAHALSARGFVIQSGYFGAEAQSDPYMAQAWIRRALHDIVDLLESQPAPMPADDVMRVMEYAFAPLDRATAQLYIDQEAIDAALREVATAIAARVPPDAQLSEDPARDAGIADVLARLPEPQRT